MDRWVVYGILLGGFATLAIWSFLYKENPFYRFFEHIYVGVGIGLTVAKSVQNWLWPKGIKVVLDGIMGRPDTPGGDPVSHWWIFYGICMAFGLLYYFIYSKKYGWLSRLVLGFSLGVGAGMAFMGFFAQFIPQIIGSFKPLLVRPDHVIVWHQIDWWGSFSNLMFVFTLLSVMTYFFFSFDHNKPVIRQMSYSGRWLMMVCFGAILGTTVMGRMALLVERLSFLSAEWPSAWKSLYLSLTGLF